MEQLTLGPCLSCLTTEDLLTVEQSIEFIGRLYNVQIRTAPYLCVSGIGNINEVLPFTETASDD